MFRHHKRNCRPEGKASYTHFLASRGASDTTKEKQEKAKQKKMEELKAEKDGMI
jgi:hypothetical protein